VDQTAIAPPGGIDQGPRRSGPHEVDVGPTDRKVVHARGDSFWFRGISPWSHEILLPTGPSRRSTVPNY
jgi:hypothetical protein